MKEKFESLLYESLQDGSYQNGLKDKMQIIRKKKNIPKLLSVWSRINAILWNPQWETGNIDKKWEQEIIPNKNSSISHQEPYYYPPVPKYKIPRWRSYTKSELATRIESKRKNFIEENIMITPTPIPAENMDTYFSALAGIDTSILSRTILYGKDINMITWHVRTPNFAYPIITSCVAYIVDTYIHPETNKAYLSHIYVYKNYKTIQVLLDFLENLEVENTEDLIATRTHLNNLHPST